MHATESSEMRVPMNVSLSFFVSSYERTIPFLSRVPNHTGNNTSVCFPFSLIGPASPQELFFALITVIPTVHSVFLLLLFIV